MDRLGKEVGMDVFSTKHCALYSHTQFNFQLFSTDSLGKEGSMILG